MNKKQILKELSNDMKNLMSYARGKGVSAAEVWAIQQRLGDCNYAFEDVDEALVKYVKNYKSHGGDTQ